MGFFELLELFADLLTKIIVGLIAGTVFLCSARTLVKTLAKVIRSLLHDLGDSDPPDEAGR